LERERLEQVRQTLLHAVNPSEDEIAAVADAPDLYDRVRARIAAEQARRARAQSLADDRMALLPSLNILLNGLRSVRWALAAAAVGVALFALAGQSELFTPAQKAPDIQAQVTPTANTPEPAPDKPQATNEKSAAQGETEGATSPTAGIRHVHAAYRRARAAAQEITTDFLPLTYAADATQESGQVVRVSMPRAALASFGLLLNVERANELIKADIIIGDDGLARAIRFVH
jgi:hypothetical protein